MRTGREKGSFTVEMALVFPVILLTIAGMIYMSVVHYQNIVASAAAMQAAAKAAVSWDYLGREDAWTVLEVDGAQAVAALPSYADHDPYRYFFDLSSETRLRSANAYMARLMRQNPKIYDRLESDGRPAAAKDGGLLQKYITVTAEKSYINPLGNTLERLGVFSRARNTVTASAPLSSPAEFVRNVSFIYELVYGRE